jgi:sugar phosphate isomerase/epimerase
VNWSDFLSSAKKIGYDDWLVVEYEGSLAGKYYTGPEKASRDAIKYLTKFHRKKTIRFRPLI